MIGYKINIYMEIKNVVSWHDMVVSRHDTVVSWHDTTISLLESQQNLLLIECQYVKFFKECNC